MHQSFTVLHKHGIVQVSLLTLILPMVAEYGRSSNEGMQFRANEQQSSKPDKGIDLLAKKVQSPDSGGSAAKPSAWATYLRETGNPMLELMVKRAGREREATLKAGRELTNSERLRDVYLVGQEEENRLGQEQLRDLQMGTQISDFPVSGELDTDARSFFSAIGLTEGLRRLDSGENARDVLTEFKDSLFAARQDAKNDPQKRKWAYSAARMGDLIDTMFVRDQLKRM
jgi:hypothetical protein